MIECSINELEALTRRAARGAGMCWGLAEEAGKMTRWLAARRLPSVELVAGLLRRNDGSAYEALAPDVAEARWKAASGKLCPVAAGAALSDSADDILAGTPVTLARVAYPLLLAPYLGRAATATGRALDLRWPGVAIRCLPNGPCIDADTPDALRAAEADEVAIAAAEDGGQPIARRPASVSVAAADWDLLKSLAMRTYVPASAESRLRGAGAGLADND